MTAERLAGWLGLPVVMLGPSKEAQLIRGFTRAPDMLDGVDVVVAFPEEPPAKGAACAVDTADPGVMALARVLRIPTLAVRRSGQAEWYSWETKCRRSE